MIQPIHVLRAVAMKGRARTEDVAAITSIDPTAACDLLGRLLADDRVAEHRGLWKVTDAGRESLEAAYESERRSVDSAVVDASYETFCKLNTSLKEAVTAWQLKPDGQINDHADALYDQDVLARIAALRTDIGELLRTLTQQLPRLASYDNRFESSLQKALAGDGAFVASPAVDSFHNVWFELHEDLIRISGRTRADEAAADRA